MDTEQSVRNQPNGIACREANGAKRPSLFAISLWGGGIYLAVKNPNTSLLTTLLEILVMPLNQALGTFKYYG